MFKDYESNTQPTGIETAKDLETALLGLQNSWGQSIWNTFYKVGNFVSETDSCMIPTVREIKVGDTIELMDHVGGWCAGLREVVISTTVEKIYQYSNAYGKTVYHIVLRQDDANLFMETNEKALAKSIIYIENMYEIDREYEAKRRGNVK